MTTKTYLGDAVYVTDDGYQIELTTENGISVIDRIYLEPGVCKQLGHYMIEHNFIDIREFQDES